MIQRPATGPYRWRLRPEANDRLRFLAHRALMAPANALGLRGGPRLSLLLQRLIGNYSAPLVAEAAPDVKLSFDGFDRYWMRVFFRGDLYEPELYRLLRRFEHIREYDFVDGGANIGFWSAVLTGREFGVRRAVAIEASPTTYGTLARTAALCGGRFATEHRALSKTVGTVTFEQGAAHASRHIVREGEAPLRTSERVTVEATTIDDLVTRHDLDASKLLVKLDVEGAELDSVLGGPRAYDAGAVYLYEDHGKEPSSILTSSLLDHGAACWFIADDGALHAVHSATEASRYKLDPTRGYNFMCTTRAHAERVLSQLS